MFGFAIIPALIQLIGMLFLPESPRWLLKYNRQEKAIRSFAKVYNLSEPEAEAEPEAEVEQEDKEESEGTIIRQERRYGKFMRRFNLGDDVHEEEISASFKNGILHLRAPKHEPKAPERRRIEIS